MATRPFSVVFDANDPAGLGRFWSGALGWPVVYDTAEEVVVECEGVPGWGEGGAPALVFIPVDEPKRSKNRVHLDLASDGPEHQQEVVSHVLGLGARRVDIGQGDVPWTVLADPEGNEFCVLEPREQDREVPAIAAVILDCADPGGLARYWAEASGWPVVERQPGYVTLRHPGDRGTPLELLATPDAKQGKNRVHFDLAPAAVDDHAAEVVRLEAAGARRVDVGQGDVTWVVLADPEGNEHCVLTPR